MLVTFDLAGPREDIPFQITVNQLMAGYTVNTRDVATMIELEDTIKSRCANLKNWLLVMATFGGYEAVEI